jgi:hypothetical protein
VYIYSPITTTCGEDRYFISARKRQVFFLKQLDICVDYSISVRTPFLELCVAASWCVPSVGRPELLLGEPTTRIVGHMIRARALLDNPNTKDFQHHYHILGDNTTTHVAVRKYNTESYFFQAGRFCIQCCPEAFCGFFV